MNEVKKPEVNEDIFDPALRELLGDQYHDHHLIMAEPEEAVYEQVQEVGSGFSWDRVRAPMLLALADGLMFYMCMGGKIDLPYGLAFLACISAAFGHSLRKAGAYEA